MVGFVGEVGGSFEGRVDDFGLNFKEKRKLLKSWRECMWIRLDFYL